MKQNYATLALCICNSRYLSWRRHWRLKPPSTLWLEVIIGGFKLEGVVGHWPRGTPLHFYVGSDFHRPTSETRGRLRGSNVRNATKCVLINRPAIPIFITTVQKQFFVYRLDSNKMFSWLFHRGLRGPYGKGLVGHCTRGHSLKPPLDVITVIRWAQSSKFRQSSVTSLQASRSHSTGRLS